MGHGCPARESLPEAEKHLREQKSSLPKKKGGKRALRYYKEVGLGFKTPKEAIEGNYIDKKCPFTGLVNVRGRILHGVITKMKMKRTCVVRRDYLKYVRKYNRFEKRHKNTSCHISPAFPDAKAGDHIIMGECRPLSKTVKFVAVKVIPKSGSDKLFKKF